MVTTRLMPPVVGAIVLRRRYLVPMYPNVQNEVVGGIEYGVPVDPIVTLETNRSDQFALSFETCHLNDGIPVILKGVNVYVFCTDELLVLVMTTRSMPATADVEYFANLKLFEFTGTA